MSRANYKAEDFIKAIPGTGGIITDIAERMGCSWHTAKKYIENYATVKQAYDDECEKVLDGAESVILEDINEREDVSTAKWYMTMKGRQRGYAKTERREIEGELVIQLDWGDNASGDD